MIYRKCNKYFRHKDSKTTIFVIHDRSTAVKTCCLLELGWSLGKCDGRVLADGLLSSILSILF